MDNRQSEALTQHDACKILAKATIAGPRKLLECYVDNAPALHGALYAEAPTQLAAEFVLDCTDPDFDRLRASAVLFDFTAVFVRTNEPGPHEVTLLHDLQRYGIESTIVEVPVEIARRHDIPEQQLRECGPAFWIPTAASVASSMREIAPMVDSSRVAVLPTRLLFFRSAGGENIALGCDPEAPLGTWQVLRSPSSRFIPVCAVGDRFSDESSMIELSVPYLSEIPFQLLSKVLEDEGDHVGKLRSALREAVRECRSNPSSTHEISSDVVRPGVERIERRFRALADSYSLRSVGVQVGFVSLILSASHMAATTPMLIAPAMGLVALTLRDYSSFLKDESAVKEGDLYLLWRLRDLRGEAGV